MSPVTDTNLEALVDCIEDAMTITKDEKLAYLKRMRTEGITPSLLQELQSVFDREVAAAREELGECKAFMERLLKEETNAASDEMPVVQQLSEEFSRTCQQCEDEATNAARHAEIECEHIVSGAQKQADQSEADAIREQLKKKN